MTYVFNLAWKIRQIYLRRVSQAQLKVAIAETKWKTILTKNIYIYIYILKLSCTSWRTLLVLRFPYLNYLNKKQHQSLSPYFRNNPRAQIRPYTGNKKYKIIEVTIVQTMLWSWSLPDWMVVHYVRLVVFLDSPVRDYGRSSLHSLSSMTERFWFSSTERNTEFGEHI